MKDWLLREERPTAKQSGGMSLTCVTSCTGSPIGRSLKDEVAGIGPMRRCHKKLIASKRKQLGLSRPAKIRDLVSTTQTKLVFKPSGNGKLAPLGAIGTPLEVRGWEEDLGALGPIRGGQTKLNVPEESTPGEMAEGNNQPLEKD